MRILVAAVLLVGAVSGAPQGYGYSRPGYGYQGGNCDSGEVVNVDGSCAIPKVTRQVYVYTAPDQPRVYLPPPPVPPPEIISNVLFIRAPEQEAAPDPIVIGPPKVNNVVYVLHKRRPDEGQRIITVPAPPLESPEVYFVNYNDGENPQLPGGVDLNTALSSAAQAGGQVIGGGVSGLSGGIGGGGSGGIGGGGGGSGSGGFGGGFTGGFNGGYSGGDFSDEIGGGYLPPPSGLYTTS